MNGKLPAFLQHAARRKFEWGQFDCCLWLADWFAFCTGNPDPVPHFRGAYHDADGARVLCGAMGHPFLVRRIARSLNLRRTHDPLPGDVALMRVQGRAIGAIRTRLGWVMLTPSGPQNCGISLAPDDSAEVRAVAAWRIP